MKVRILVNGWLKGGWKVIGIKEEVLEQGKYSLYADPQLVEEIMSDLRAHKRSELLTRTSLGEYKHVYLLLEHERESWGLADRALSQKVNGFSID